MNRLSTAAALAILLAGCKGAPDGGCLVIGEPPSLAGTPIPAQPIPATSGVRSTVSTPVKVVVDANGNVVSVSIATSSGNGVIDQTALSVVANSKLRPGFPGCGATTTPDTTTVTVTFSPSA